MSELTLESLARRLEEVERRLNEKQPTVTGRLKTSHSWALLKTSHDVMGLVSSTRLYSDCRPGQRARPRPLSFSSF